jgi:hypothetical protein
MPNTNRPDDTRCPDHTGIRGLGCRTGEKVSAVCAFCDLGTCNGDGAPMTPEQVETSRRECPTADPHEVYCPTCLAEIKGDAVPVAVEDVPTKAERTPTDAELLAERQAAAL